MSETDEIIEENIRRYIKEHSTTIKAYTQEYVDELQNQLQQKENIIKEVREYIEIKMSVRKNCENIYSYDIRNKEYIKQCDELLEILDKENIYE